MDAQGRVGGVSLVDLVAEFGSPLYVYDGDAIRAQFRAYLAHGLPRELQLHFAMKANSNLAILRLLAAEGAGFDIVSGGELARVLQAGGDAAQVVFSGVAKSDAEMQRRDFFVTYSAAGLFFLDPLCLPCHRMGWKDRCHDSTQR